MKNIRTLLLFLAVLCVVSCGGGIDTKTDDDMLKTDTGNDTEATADTDILIGLAPGEQQYAAALADTGRGGDITVSDPAGNGEAIATDSTTGLIWQQVAATTYPGCKQGTNCTWQQAVDYCENLTYAGFDDWHIPTPHELPSLNDYVKSGIYENASTATTGSDYWTSFPDAGDQGYAWTFSSFNGMIVNGFPVGDYQHKEVMCIRRDGVVPFSGTRYTEMIGDDDEIIVTDNLTKLEWTKEYVENKTWDEARAYCADLIYGDKEDWRLPGVNELRSLVDYGRYEPASNFPGMPNGHFWTVHSSFEGAWFVYFNSGYVYYATVEYSAKVRCIRP